MGNLFDDTPMPPPLPPLPPGLDAEEEAQQRRLEAIKRRRKGRSGLVVTSSRGLLDKAESDTNRKTLLGE